MACVEILKTNDFTIPFFTLGNTELLL